MRRCEGFRRSEGFIRYSLTAMEKLSDFTSLSVGGSAKEFIHARSEKELIQAVDSADARGKNVLILGSGSNILVSDKEFDGVVVKVENSGNSYEIDACSGGMLQVSAGDNWDEFVAFTLEKGLANLESLSGIPGTVGAAPIQNIGAYGHEVSEVIARVRSYDRVNKEIKTFTASECEFGYRTSRFKRELGRYVVLDVTFQLRRGTESLPIQYQELADELGVSIGARVDTVKVREAVLRLRTRKGMVAGLLKSAGSFFTNPILTSDIASKLPSDAPRWVQSDGSVKTSAAWLIEKSGFKKGDAHGGASISPHHVLALTNAGDATCEEILDLARDIQKRVESTFGITLEPEVQFVGVKL